jgi:hypothetical protein
MYRIGILLPNTPAIAARNPRIRALLQGLQDLGWIDGQNVTPSPWLSSTQATPSEQDWCKASLGLVEILLA